MSPRGILSTAALVAIVALALACREAAEEPGEPQPFPLDSLTAEEEASFAVDPLRFPEMLDGRLDTVNMRAEVPTGPGELAAWHVQAVNYTDSHIALTYAFWYTGPDSVAVFAADRQPRLVDDLGNVYEAMLVPDNPRLRIEAETTGVGVIVFTPAVVEGADSLTLSINDSTTPVLKVGPWGVDHRPPAGGIQVRPRE